MSSLAALSPPLPTIVLRMCCNKTQPTTGKMFVFKVFVLSRRLIPDASKMMDLVIKSGCCALLALAAQNIPAIKIPSRVIIVLSSCFQCVSLGIFLASTFSELILLEFQPSKEDYQNQLSIYTNKLKAYVDFHAENNSLQIAFIELRKRFNNDRLNYTSQIQAVSDLHKLKSIQELKEWTQIVLDVMQHIQAKVNTSNTDLAGNLTKAITLSREWMEKADTAEKQITEIIAKMDLSIA